MNPALTVSSRGDARGMPNEKAERMSTAFASVPGKVVSSWLAQERAVVDAWESFFIGLPEFKKAIFESALPKAAKLGATAWIVDTRNARGVLPDEVLTFISQHGHALFAAKGIKHFITVRPKSPTAALSLQRVEKVVGPSGMQLITVDSVEAALEFLRSERKSRAA